MSLSFQKWIFLSIFSFTGSHILAQRSADLSSVKQINNVLQKREPGTKFKDCLAYLNKDSLILENALIKRIYLFNNGNLLPWSIVNKQSGKIYGLQGKHPDFSLPGIKGNPSGATFNSFITKESPQQAAHLEAEVLVYYGDLQVKRVFKLYPSTPAIACDIFLKGNASQWKEGITGLQQSGKSNEVNKAIIDRLPVPDRNWKVKSVEFFDSTDRNNTLVQEYARVPYTSEILLKGNILLMEKLPSREGIFWLKEAPVSNMQLYYPGFDFSITLNDFKTVGLGISPEDVSDTEWVRGYSIVTGVSIGGEEGAQIALRTYQQNNKPMLPEVDNMIMLNTWGDRGRDENINETFILNEIKLGSKLGITHLQMDDGWQTGKSGASAFAGGSLGNIWRNADYWFMDPIKFPNGFQTILKEAKKSGIIISTWFNPSIDSSFKHWQKDAAVMINQYKDYGIHIWKIDGVVIADKKAEINFRKMLDSVVANTDGKAIFNLDVTAGKRFGYHYFNEYGNLFLENRYTDFGSYYPHSTLRNLWMLSKYIPPQRLQIEFLNKWRNQDKYPTGDPFAPVNYSFDYLFALTMAAQPLAWMEVRNLPEKAYNSSRLIKTYKDHWQEWHSGQIFPIGEEPSGISWTGFQSVLKDPSSGFVLVLREMNSRTEMNYKLSQLPPGKYSFELIAGSGKSFLSTIHTDRILKFNLPGERSFAFYKYKLIN